MQLVVLGERLVRKSVYSFPLGGVGVFFSGESFLSVVRGSTLCERRYLSLYVVVCVQY